MQLTNLNSLKRDINNYSRRAWVWGLCSVLAFGHYSEAKPKFNCEVDKDGELTATYSHDRQFLFSRQENDRLIRTVLEKLPMAKSATMVTSSPVVKSGEVKHATYSSRNLKQTHTVAVNFVRSDYLPMMYFKVIESWKDCDNPQYCQENLELEVTGPTRIVRDLSDFGAFPKALNVVDFSIKFENEESRSSSYAAAYGPGFGAGAAPSEKGPSTVTWNFAFKPGADDGFEDYLRYFRLKAIKSQEKISSKNIKIGFGIWAANVSRTAFNSVN